MQISQGDIITLAGSPVKWTCANVLSEMPYGNGLVILQWQLTLVEGEQSFREQATTFEIIASPAAPFVVATPLNTPTLVNRRQSQEFGHA